MLVTNFRKKCPVGMFTNKHLHSLGKKVKNLLCKYTAITILEEKLRISARLGLINFFNADAAKYVRQTTYVP